MYIGNIFLFSKIYIYILPIASFSDPWQLNYYKYTHLIVTHYGVGCPHVILTWKNKEIDTIIKLNVKSLVSLNAGA